MYNRRRRVSSQQLLLGRLVLPYHRDIYRIGQKGSRRTMTTESIMCANCGAPIRPGDSALVFTCPQCGAELTITRVGDRSHSSVQPNDPAYKMAANLRNGLGETPYESTGDVVALS